VTHFLSLNCFAPRSAPPHALAISLLVESDGERKQVLRLGKSVILPALETRYGARLTIKDEDDNDVKKALPALGPTG